MHLHAISARFNLSSAFNFALHINTYVWKAFTALKPQKQSDHMPRQYAPEIFCFVRVRLQ